MSIYEQLPLVRSTQETIALWPEMDTMQRLGACAATIITTARPVARFLLEGSRNEKPIDTLEFAAHLAIDLSDGADGEIARYTGGVTPFGQEYDPFMDKIDFLIQEIAAVKRKELSVGHVATRITRDVLVTGLRSHVLEVSDGKADVSAGQHGKNSTFLREASNRIASLRLGSEGFRRAHQTTATGALILTGAMNAKQLLDERQKYA